MYLNSSAKNKEYKFLDKSIAIYLLKSSESYSQEAQGYQPYECII